MGALVSWATSCLLPSRTASLDAQVLLAHALKQNRAWVLAHADTTVSGRDLALFGASIELRSVGVPVAYLRGYCDWFGIRLEVNESVLVPRPETELLVMEAVAIASRLGLSSFADIGTGSGAIALGITHSLPHARVIATDVSEQALNIARHNVRRLGAGDCVTLKRGSLLAPLREEPDLIAANLPYLDDHMMEDLDADVRHEPRIALHGGRTGVELYDELLRQRHARAWRGSVLMEIDPRQVTDMAALLSAHGVEKWRIVRDYAGLKRIVVVGG